MAKRIKASAEARNVTQKGADFAVRASLRRASEHSKTAQDRQWLKGVPGLRSCSLEAVLQILGS